MTQKLNELSIDKKVHFERMPHNSGFLFFGACPHP